MFSRTDEPILVGSRMGEKMLLKKVKRVTPLGGEFELVR
jgi:hypothetical protein